MCGCGADLWRNACRHQAAPAGDGIAHPFSFWTGLLASTIYDALKFQASDIHLECNVASLVIKYRVDGVMVQAGQVHGLNMAEQIISRIKVMADLDYWGTPDSTRRAFQGKGERQRD